MKNRKEIIQQIIKERPNAVLAKNKYKVICGLIRRKYPNNYEKINPNIWESTPFDAINGNRDWQMLTENEDKDNKKRLSDEFKIKNDYMPNLGRNYK